MTKLTPMGTMIDAIWSLRESKRAKEAEIKTLEEEIATTEELLIARMDQEGVDKSTGKKASVSVAIDTRFNVKDFDAFWAFIKKNNYSHAIERRPAKLACIEIMEKKGNVPGLEKYTKRKLNVRTLS